MSMYRKYMEYTQKTNYEYELINFLNTLKNEDKDKILYIITKIEDKYKEKIKKIDKLVNILMAVSIFALMMIILAII